MPTKILWYGDSAILHTGFATVARNVLSGLAKMYPGQYEVAQLGLNHHPYASYDHNIYPFDIIMPYGSDPTSALRSYCEVFKPDLVIMNHDLWITKFAVEDGALPNRKFPIAFYQPIDGVTITGGVPLSWQETIQKQDFTITYAEWARDAYLRVCPEMTDRISAISHGVDTKLFRPEPQLKQSNNDDSILVGMVAMNQYRKDHPTLLRAIAKVAKKFPNIKLYMHCPVTNRIGFDLRQLIVDYGISDNVIDTSVDGVRVSEGGIALLQDMPGIYNMLDMHVLSTTGEGFGLPHAEAMACGIPSLATDYTTLHDLMPFKWQRVEVSDFRVLHNIPLQRALTDPNDLAEKISDLCAMSSKERQQLGLQCRQRILPYDWSNIIPLWHDHIQYMIQKGRIK